MSDNRLKMEKTTIQIGLEKPLKLLHVTDSHLVYADERDDERKRELARNRRKSFRFGPDEELKLLEQMIDYSNENCDMLVYTGDLIDFVSAENLEKGSEALKKAKDLFFIVGNHEFSKYVGEAVEDMPYKMSSYDQVSASLGDSLLFRSRQIGGVNLVGVDNGYYLVEDWQTEKLKEEVAKGLPIILLMHNPIYAQPLYEEVTVNRKNRCAYLMGCDEAHLASYEEHRRVQQRPDEATLRFIDYVYSQPLIRAVLAGHLHFSYECPLENGVMQYVTGGGYRGDVREITLL